MMEIVVLRLIMKGNKRKRRPAKVITSVSFHSFQSSDSIPDKNSPNMAMFSKYNWTCERRENYSNQEFQGMSEGIEETDCLRVRVVDLVDVGVNPLLVQEHVANREHELVD